MFVVVSTEFLCNLTAATNGANISIKLNFNDGNSYDYNFMDSYLLIPKNYSQTKIYLITALIQNPSSLKNFNFGMNNSINGNFGKFYTETFILLLNFEFVKNL